MAKWAEFKATSRSLLLKFLLAPLVICFLIFLVIFTSVSFFTQGADSLFLNASLSLIFSLVISLSIFVTIAYTKISNAIWSIPRLRRFDESLDKRIYQQSTMKDRLIVRNVFLCLCVPAIVLSIIYFSHYFATNFGAFPTIATSEYWVGYFFFGLSLLSFIISKTIYTEREKTIYFLKQATDEIEFFVSNKRKRPNSSNLSIGLSSSQRVMPRWKKQSFKPLVSEAKELLQTGTIEQIQAVKAFINMIIQSIEQRNENSYDNYIRSMNGFLQRSKEQNNQALKIHGHKKKSYDQNNVITKISDFFKMAFYKATEKVVVFLLSMIILSAIVLAVLYLTGFNLANLPFWNP